MGRAKKNGYLERIACEFAIVVYSMYMDIDKIIRSEIKNAKKSRSQISKETGVSQTRLCRFLQGEGLGTGHAGVLLDYFGYAIKKRKGRQK